MGYSKNRNAFLRVEPLLAVILKNKDKDKFFIPVNDVYHTLYALREGLNYISDVNDSPYKELKTLFKFKYSTTGIEVVKRKIISFESPVHLLAENQNLIINEATNIIEIVGAAVAHKGTRMEFPNAVVVGNAIKNLEMWANKNQYQIVQIEPYIIIEKYAAPVTGSESGERGVVQDELS